MARQRSVGVVPHARSQVRDMLDRGRSRRAIIAEVTDRFPQLTARQAGRLVTEETAGKDAVARLTGADKRLRVDLTSLPGCTPDATRLRMSVDIQWTDPHTGITRTFGTTVETGASGRLADLLNDAIGQVVDAARARGYDPGRITSAQTSGRTSYRINYVDCI